MKQTVKRIFQNRRRRILATVGLALALGITGAQGIPAAFASASSGYQFSETLSEHSGQVNFCGEATIVDTAQNRSWDLSNTYNNPCSLTSNLWNAPSGYLGVDAEGLTDGGMCGFTGYAYNSTETYNFGVGANECGNQGCQGYYTIAYQGNYQYSDGQYWGGFDQTSPEQNYYC